MILSLAPIKNGMFEQDVVAKDLKRRGSHDDPIRLLADYRFIKRSFQPSSNGSEQLLLGLVA